MGHGFPNFFRWIKIATEKIENTKYFERFCGRNHETPNNFNIPPTGIPFELRAGDRRGKHGGERAVGWAGRAETTVRSSGAGALGTCGEEERGNTKTQPQPPPPEKRENQKENLDDNIRNSRRETFGVILDKKRETCKNKV